MIVPTLRSYLRFGSVAQLGSYDRRIVDQDKDSDNHGCNAMSFSLLLIEEEDGDKVSSDIEDCVREVT